MDIDPGSVLTNRGLNGYGYGSYGSHGNGHANFPGDGSAVNANVMSNRDFKILESINRTSSDQFQTQANSAGHGALRDAITSGNEFLTDRITSQSIDAKFANVANQLSALDRSIIAGFASAERVAFTNQQTTIAQLHAMDIKQTECCCELKAGQAAISAKLDADRASAAEAEVNNLRLQIQINNQGRGQGQGNG